MLDMKKEDDVDRSVVSSIIFFDVFLIRQSGLASVVASPVAATTLSPHVALQFSDHTLLCVGNSAATHVRELGYAPLSPSSGRLYCAMRSP